MFRPRLPRSFDVLAPLAAGILFLVSLMAGTARADTLYVTEFAGAPPTSVYYQAAKTPAVANQTVAIGVSSTQSAAFNVNTGLVRIAADIACNVVVGGSNPTATTSSMRLAAGQTEYFVVTPGQKLAVIVAPELP